MFNCSFNLNRRNFLKSMMICLPIKNYAFHSLCSEDEFSYISKGPLTGSIYYTEKNPGRWKTIKESHIPEITKKGDILEVFTSHEMKGYDHYIIKHIILDNKLNIISEKIFDPSRDIPLSKHNISGYDDRVYALSVCNLHDTWLNFLMF